MRNLIILAALTLSSVSMAATCPSNSSQVLSCLSTPRGGDGETASSTFDSIAICQKGNSKELVFEKNGDQESSQATVVVRNGATSYSVRAGDVEFTLATMVTGQKTNNAKFTVNFKAAQIQSSSTYSCK